MTLLVGNLSDMGLKKSSRRERELALIALTFSSLLIAPISVVAQSLTDWIDASCESCTAQMTEKTGVYILEKGEEALMGRAWLAQHARQSIDVQYFIWSTDNIGILAAEMLLKAADRGVTVRVLVDDFLIDAEGKTLLLLAGHPNIHIRIYNPNYSVGTSFFGRMFNSVSNFRDTNQRMHDKTAIFDGVAGITGGRNMADEYFDFNPDYNFRDRDVLLLGSAVQSMRQNFDEFWESPLAAPVEELLEKLGASLTAAERRQKFREMHAYARNPVNFQPAIKIAIESLPTRFPRLLQAMTWQDVRFISDAPGKNAGESGFAGGGSSTHQLIKALKGARESVLIQSPYLVVTERGIELFRELRRRGVHIRISTNSLASTDNIPAFSGYFKKRDQLIDAGIELYEFKPHPHIQSELIERYPQLEGENPVFALHAKSMVIDGEQVFIGTFNLDPRSANLNTEVGILVRSRELGRQLTESIEKDLLPGNSWRTTASFNPDSEVSRSKRFELGFVNLFRIDPVL